MPNFLSKILSFGAIKDSKHISVLSRRSMRLSQQWWAMSDECFCAQTEKFWAPVMPREGEQPDDLPRGLQQYREASAPYKATSSLGGIALHKGTIAEMKTGEGKTLVSTLLVTQRTERRRRAHIVTASITWLTRQ